VNPRRTFLAAAALTTAAAILAVTDGRYRTAGVLAVTATVTGAAARRRKTHWLLERSPS
jgi:hypothetical protein